MTTETDVEALHQREQAAKAYKTHPALLRLQELETLRELARTDVGCRFRFFLPFAWGPLSKRDLGSWLLEATSELRRRAAQRPSSPVARKLADFIGGRFADIAAHKQKILGVRRHFFPEVNCSCGQRSKKLGLSRSRCRCLLAVKIHLGRLPRSFFRLEVSIIP